MTPDQTTIFAILAAVFVLFLWGRWRYDIVAFLALLTAVVAGVVPAADAFTGFGHPATVTVALVLILSRALSNSGAVDVIARHLTFASERLSALIGALSGVAATLSAMMNNVGALALLMPVALQAAAKAKQAPGAVLMPLSFASILGGLVTMIGTPPNIIIATYREKVTGEPFAMFDFTPVGGLVAIAGVLFVALVGWRLIPAERRTGSPATELFDLEDYVAEVRAPKDSDVVGMTLADLEELTGDIDAEVVGIVRRGKRLPGLRRRDPIRASDSLVVEASAEELDKFVTKLGLTLVGNEKAKSGLLASEDVALVEAVVTPQARVEGRSGSQLRLKSRHGVNLLGISRQGRPIRTRIGSVRLRAGDILLLQGDAEQLPEVVATLGCLPLAGRGLLMGKRRHAGVCVAIFAAAIAAAAFGFLPIYISLAVAAAGVVMLSIVPPREIYESVDWAVILLLGAMIPLGEALEATGGTQLIASGVTGLAAYAPPAVLLALVLIVTMTLSDIMNNAATAVVAAPIAVGVAQGIGVNPDPFLMAVAVGASCAFLTPIGHQNNMLIMGPGGYRFGDYWRMGLPLEALIVVLAIPLILWVWPL